MKYKNVFLIAAVCISMTPGDGLAQSAKSSFAALNGIWTLDSVRYEQPRNEQAESAIKTSVPGKIEFRLDSNRIDFSINESQNYSVPSESEGLPKRYIITENTLELIAGAGIVYRYTWSFTPSGLLKLQNGFYVWDGPQQSVKEYCCYYHRIANKKNDE